SDTRPDVLIIHAPDLNSYSKLMKKAQAAGTYVILVDNPANFPADAFVGSDWDRLGQLEAEAAIKGCGENSSKKIGLVQGDQANSSSLYQYAGIMKVLDKHPDFKVVAKPDSNWDATTSRNVTTTMLQQNPDICSIIDFWDGDATGASAAIRDAKLDGKVFLVTTGGGEKAADCDKLNDGTYGAVVMTDLARQSGDMNAIIKFLLQSGQPAGTSHTYIYTLEKATTKADLKPDSCWDLKALQSEAAAK
ncbi:sugar ABC transporter substrate-binding protein, partial [Mesorhizobium sp. M8A.F.Ca.ET.023.01.1.1]